MQLQTILTNMTNWSDYYTYDDGLLLNKRGHIFCNFDKDGYIRVRRNGKEYRAHRIIWEMFNGPIPEGMLIDHEDRDVYNNKIENLRLVTRLQNNHNSIGSNFTDLPKGVTKVGKRFRARLSHKGVIYCLGTYDTPKEASDAYTAKALEVHGEEFMYKGDI